MDLLPVMVIVVGLTLPLRAPLQPANEEQVPAVAVTGTVASPKTKVKLGKFLAGRREYSAADVLAHLLG